MGDAGFETAGSEGEGEREGAVDGFVDGLVEGLEDGLVEGVVEGFVEGSVEAVVVVEGEVVCGSLTLIVVLVISLSALVSLPVVSTSVASVIASVDEPTAFDLTLKVITSP